MRRRFEQAKEGRRTSAKRCAWGRRSDMNERGARRSRRRVHAGQAVEPREVRAALSAERTVEESNEE
ncbi:hypothetical protein C0Z19_05660 [Trinickia soli]|uniref:Uncharacterized protein n=1 Tax=Trinickia soli TaxID=380675 RepID=A0A2N7WCW9_9BURK|nr:hypothetical protein CIW54_19470 [Paraburkholderia sp. T12-10]PMS27224.1 hypothetical protein C0Z19_05660 [Trinickia soli]